MLKTSHFLRKSTFFNTLFVLLALLSVRWMNAQSSNHGESFVMNEDINKTSEVFQGLKVSDSLTTQMKGTIMEVCQAKGCWMKVNLSDEKEVFVKFKDYGFFVPTDSQGKEVIMNGLAFIEEMSVEDQRHYAMDKGASEEEAKQITAPKRTLRFEADGVYISSEK